MSGGYRASNIARAIPAFDWSELPAAPARFDRRAECLAARGYQGQLSACLGDAFRSAVNLVTNGQGVPVSELAIYTGARVREKARRSDAIPDVGCMPVDAAGWVREFGICAASSWPLDPATVGDLVPWDVEQESASNPVPDVFEIVASTYAERIEAAKRACAAGYGVVACFHVDRAYAQHDGSSVWEGISTPDIGGHAQTIAGFDGEEFWLDNWWSRPSEPPWGANGFGRVTSGVIARAMELLVVTKAPVLR